MLKIASIVTAIFKIKFPSNFIVFNFLNLIAIYASIINIDIQTGFI